MTTPNDDTTRRTDTETAPDATETTPPGATGSIDFDSIPGRIPLTEEAGAPLVPPIEARRAGGDDDRPETAGATGRRGTRTAGSPPRTPRQPPTDEDWDAPLVPDLRPARRTRTDGGSR